MRILPKALFLSAAFAVVVLPCAAVASPGPSISTTPLKVSYLDETALVFKADQQTASTLPRSIFLTGAPLTFATDITLACHSVAAGRGDLLVYLPGARICLSLTELFTLAQELHPEQALFALLERDRRTLQERLESAAVMVVQPRFAPALKALLESDSVAGFCSCPNPTDPIIEDGFEELP